MCKVSYIWRKLVFYNAFRLSRKWRENGKTEQFASAIMLLTPILLSTKLTLPITSLKKISDTLFEK